MTNCSHQLSECHPLNDGMGGGLFSPVRDLLPLGQGPVLLIRNHHQAELLATIYSLVCSLPTLMHSPACLPHSPASVAWPRSPARSARPHLLAARLGCIHLPARLSSFFQPAQVGMTVIMILLAFSFAWV